MVRRVEDKIDFDTSCNKDGLYYPSEITSLVRDVENRLQIKKYDKEKLEKILDEMTDSKINTASEMFFFLNSCSEEIRPWQSFYTDLFQNKSPSKIILTLNRILKRETNEETEDFRNIARILLMKMASKISLKYEEILNLMLMNFDDTEKNKKIREIEGM